MPNFEKVFELLVRLNEYARVDDEKNMYITQIVLDNLLRPIQMESIRDEEHKCYTIGITEYIQVS